MIGIAVIGVGFMGRTHIRSYQRAAAEGFQCELVAVCDVSASALQSTHAGNLAAAANDQPLFDSPRVRIVTDPNDLFSDPAVQLVSICTYTDSHVDLAIRALRSGKHVLVEKPVALHSREVKRLADTARQSGRICMPAMCMRFWPGWDWLHERVRDQDFGKVRSATFQRLGSQPVWAQSFYGDIVRSGGALLDLHIHDVDFIHWCFGPPESVAASGTSQHLTTHYRFADGPGHVVAEAAWDLNPNAGFRMRYLVNFERATADFDLAQPQQLMLHHADGSRAINVANCTGYDGEIRHVLDAIAGKAKSLTATLDEAVLVMRTLEAERKSVDAQTIQRI